MFNTAFLSILILTNLLADKHHRRKSKALIVAATVVAIVVSAYAIFMADAPSSNDILTSILFGIWFLFFFKINRIHNKVLDKKFGDVAPRSLPKFYTLKKDIILLGDDVAKQYQITQYLFLIYTVILVIVILLTFLQS